MPHSAVAARSSLRPGLEFDVVRRELTARAQELLVEAAERRAAIAGDEARGVEPGAAVALLLHQAEPDQRLVAGHEDPVLGQVVFVVEADRVDGRHSVLCGAALGLTPYIEEAAATRNAEQV